MKFGHLTLFRLSNAWRKLSVNSCWIRCRRAAYLGDVYPFRRRCVDVRPNPKPRPYLYLWGGVWIVLLHLVTPPALRLGRGGVLCRLLCCC